MEMIPMHDGSIHDINEALLLIMANVSHVIASEDIINQSFEVLASTAVAGMYVLECLSPEIASDITRILEESNGTEGSLEERQQAVKEAHRKIVLLAESENDKAEIFEL